MLPTWVSLYSTSSVTLDNASLFDLPVLFFFLIPNLVGKQCLIGFLICILLCLMATWISSFGLLFYLLFDIFFIVLYFLCILVRSTLSIVCVGNIFSLCMVKGWRKGDRKKKKKRVGVVGDREREKHCTQTNRGKQIWLSCQLTKKISLSN